MNPIRRAVLGALLILGPLLPAAEKTAPPSIAFGARQIAESGRHEHALRSVEKNLLDYPDDEQLLELRATLTELIARTAGNQTVRPVATVPPPAFAPSRPEPGRNFTTDTAGIPMVWIAPGTFRLCNPMGSDDDTDVTLSRGYWLGATEVTQEQWQAVMENIPSPSYFKGSDRPVERVSWVSAMEFCRKVTERERAAGRLPEGYECTLPTEAQWEYACRAGTTGRHSGDLAAMAWYAPNGANQTHPVAQRQPNPWGLYDMYGNVWEWCADGYGGYPGGHVTDPMTAYDGPSAGMTRIIRGGAWANGAGDCSSDSRSRASMNFANIGTGFRVALAPQRK